MLRETLKQEIDTLGDNQLQRLAALITAIKTQAKGSVHTAPLWQHATPAERSQDFKNWVADLPKMGVSLPDDAFDRESIYE